MTKIAVIGSGVGGLAVAARLQALGHAVTVFEKQATFGGKLARFEKEGYVFDLGPSLFTLPAVYRDLFDRTGKPLDDQIEIVAPSPAFRYQFPDGQVVKLPASDPGRIASALGAALGSAATTQWLSLIKHAAQIWQLTRVPILESPLNGWRDLIPLAKNPLNLLKVRPWQSLRRVANQHLKDPRLIMLLDRYATYTGSDPRKAPAALITVPYLEQNFGAWHISGGIHQLGVAVYGRCNELGVEFRFNTQVQKIQTQGNSVKSIILDTGEEIEFDLVVSNTDAQLLYSKLIDHPLAKKALQRLTKSTPSLSGFVLLLAVEGKTPDIEHHNVWFPADYDAEFDQIFSKHPQPVTDPTIYACVPDDASMRPNANSESWFVLVNAPRHGVGPGLVDWNQPGMKENYAKNILSRLTDRGVNLEGRIKWQQIRTPADLESEFNAPGGSIYGSSSNGVRAAFLRPMNKSSINGLYLVGGSSHPGGGLPLVGLSARIVANLIGKAK